MTPAGGRTVVFVYPGDPDTRTGGFIYDRTIQRGLDARGWRTQARALPAGWPAPTPPRLAAAEAVLAACPDDALVVMDGLAGGVLDGVLARQADRLRLVGLVHHPLADETGLDSKTRAAFQATETRALATMRRVIATSALTASTLTADYGVPASRIGVVRPGVDPAPRAGGSGGEGVHLLCVATLTPRKGHLVLLDALAQLRDRPWRLTCAGSDTRDPDHARAARDAVRGHGLAGRVDLIGEVDADRLAALYDRADLLVLPSFHEGFGMVVVEAVARGVPVVASDAGAIPEALPPGAGILVPPGDPKAWAAALAALLDDGQRRAALRDGAARARPTLRSWDDAVDAFAIELESVPPP